MNDNIKPIVEALVSLAKGFLREILTYYNNKNALASLLKAVRASMALVVVFLALGFVPHRTLQRHAIAAAATSTTALKENNIQNKKLEEEGGVVSVYKKELLDTVNLLERRLQEVRELDKDKTDANVQNLVQKLEEALEIISVKSRSLRGQALIDLEAAVARMKREEAVLIKEAQKAVDSYLSAKTELERLSGQGEEDERLQRMREMRENEVRDAENRFRDVWSKLAKLEADMLVKETEGLHVALQELPAIEEQSQDKVDELFRHLSRTTSKGEYQGYAKESIVARIEKDLENAGKKTWEQRLLPVQWIWKNLNCVWMREKKLIERILTV